MKRKYRIPLALWLLAAVLCFTSCSAEEITSEWREYFVELSSAVREDIAEFDLREFTAVPPTSDKSFHLEPDTSDAPIGGTDSILVSHPHCETWSGERTETSPPTALGYVKTERLLLLDAEEAAERLTALGVAYSVKEAENPLAAGRVYAVEYAGVGTSDAHYINPAVPVTLYVSKTKPIFPEAAEANTVYITFDDGPEGEETFLLLDILDSYGIKATFFLLGEAMVKHPEAVEEILRRGHDIACHSMTHVYRSIYASSDALMAEVDAWTALAEELGADFSETPKLFRYPGGSVSGYLTAALRRDMNAALLERGYLVYDWTVVANDALLSQCPSGTSRYWYIIENFLETYETAKAKGEPIILLLHENIAETRSVLPWIIEYLMKDGCTFAPLSHREEQWTFADRK